MPEALDPSGCFSELDMMLVRGACKLFVGLLFGGVMRSGVKKAYDVCVIVSVEK
jgi:hypothetical protein